MPSADPARSASSSTPALSLGLALLLALVASLGTDGVAGAGRAGPSAAPAHAPSRQTSACLLGALLFEVQDLEESEDADELAGDGDQALDPQHQGARGDLAGPCDLASRLGVVSGPPSDPRRRRPDRPPRA